MVQKSLLAIMCLSLLTVVFIRLVILLMPNAAIRAWSMLTPSLWAIMCGLEHFQQNPWTGEISWGERDITPEEEVDESTLKEVAAKTGGKFYRAENKEQLEEIYSEIDQLEKTEIETVAYARYAEKFYPWLLAGAFLILLELLLANTRFVRIP